MKKIILTAVAALMLTLPAKAEDLQENCANKLYKFKGKNLPMNAFFIEKNDNENTAFYDINVSDGKIDPHQPLNVYWIMYAKKGQKEGLTTIERKLAFGVNSVRQIIEGREYAARIASMDRDIVIKYTDGCPRVDTTINGRPAKLEKIKLELKGPSFFATLIYMDIYGQDIETGEPIIERWYYN